ncbi:MAG: leucine-rich repeat protein [Clostridia bacterium]|nr:leucine-rich repeat protein [Clostridia bacterium]
MSWVCPICSTNNEESESKCIVCEYERVSDKICTLTNKRVQKLRLTGNVVIPKEFNVIGEGAFKGRTDIYSVTLHDKVRKISREAFSGCCNLKSIISECELESIGMKAFAECTSLPVSARIRAKYVANDAYYIAPKPIRTSTSQGTSSVKSETVPPKTVPSKTVPPDTKSYTTTPPKAKSNWHKRLAQILLLGVCSLLLVPIVNLFSSAFQSGKDSVFSTFIGVVLLLIFIYALCSRNSDESSKAFFKESKIIPGIFALIISYVLSVVWGDDLMWINVCITSTLLLGELIFLGKTIYRNNNRFIPILIYLIIANSILLWRIILV